MSRSVQIILIAIICYTGLTLGEPIFQGLKVQRGFEIEFKPFTFKPLSFFKEIWSPLGVYGARKGIQKRELSTTILLGNQSPPVAPPLPPAPAPVHEMLEEVAQQPIANFRAPIRPLAPGPDPSNPALANIRPPVDTFRPIDGLYTNIGPVPPVNSNLIESPREVFGAINGELPPRPIGPLKQQPAGPLPPPPVGPLPQEPVHPIQVPPMNVVPLITPPVPIPAASPAEIPPTEGPLVKGSRIALYLGSALVKMVSQFLANAKLQISQFTTPAPAPVPVPPPNLPAVQVMPLMN